jgi:hypothetical protein
LEPIYYRDNPGWRKKYYALAYNIRGTGSLSHRTKAYRKDYLDFAYNILEGETSVVDEMFDLQQMIRLQVAPHENLLKTAYLLKTVQNKSYKEWLRN